MHCLSKNGLQHCSWPCYYIYMCSMNLLQAPNQHHFEVVFIGLPALLRIPHSNVWGNTISRNSKTKVNIENSVISSSNYVVLYVHV